MTTCITMDNKCYCTRALNTFAAGGKMKKCHVCGEEYSLLHFCTVGEVSHFDFGDPKKTVQSFDSWFAPIEKYIEERL